eukprot:CAMPEP_0182452728 /NCGR_PEP_ID=MMETSP1319-20130603/74_1 /TAXON_ID=172717 /ORGANISM="Bolidomonas pacifica, Strain RCC208" /LENGTH=214 /DNA_ID=CAMNT_0024650589 /DNA_START=135 /DNA_END=779 /DNA_ORIENTATION=-
MKLAIVATLIASASAFQMAPVSTPASVIALKANKVDRRAAAAMMAGALFAPASALASAGESPKFSVFGIIGDGTSLSEGAAYGSDQTAKTYSPYSPYSDSADAAYLKAGGKSGAEYVARKKAVIAETKVRLGRLDGYIEKKKWYEVKNELTRYMYETRGACTFLATSVQQKEAAADFFRAIEKVTLNSTMKNQQGAFDATKEAIAKLDAFEKLV